MLNLYTRLDANYNHELNSIDLLNVVMLDGSALPQESAPSYPCQVDVNGSARLGCKQF
jgi:hypothetical protein